MSLFPNNKTIANFFFQQDFASAHNDKAATKYFSGHDISWLDWPGNSPEFKLIEALWVIVKKAEGCKVTVGFISQERQLNVPKMKKKKGKKPPYLKQVSNARV